MSGEEAPRRQEPGTLAEDTAYWQQRLAGLGRPAGWPLDQPRAAAPRGARREAACELDQPLASALARLCGGNPTLLLVAFTAAVKACLYRATGSADTVVGVVVEERRGELAPVERILPVRTPVAGDDTLRELLAKVKRTLADAYAHRHLPLGRLRQLLAGGAAGGEEPPFRVAVAVHDSGGWRRLAPDVMVLVGWRDGLPDCRLDYDPALFDAESMARFAGNLGQTLATLATHPANRLDELALAPPGEAADGGGDPIERAAPGSAPPPPLSFAQQRLWFLQQLEPDSAAYNVPLVIALDGELDAAVLARGLDELVSRHESLRTTFPLHGGEPFQLVQAPARRPLPLADLSALGLAERQALDLPPVRAEIRRPFDLTRGPLVRPLLLRLGERRHLLLWNLHHIVCDGWSLGVLTGDLAALYPALAAGRPSPLPPLPLQYSGFATWQRAAMSGENLERQLAHWRLRLADLPPPLELPVDRPRPAAPGHRAGTVAAELPSELAAALTALARRCGATPFMLLLAAWKALLFRYTGRTDLLVGTPIANRGRIELEGLVGLCVNTLVLRTDLAGDPSLSTLAARVREVTVDAHAHQDLPFERLVEELAPRRDARRTPLFQVGFALQRARSPLVLPGLAVRPLPVTAGAAKFDLFLTVEEAGAGLVANLEFSADLFDRPTLLRLLGHYRALLAAAAAHPDRPVAALALLAAAERWQMVGEWNATGAPYPADRTLHAVFAAQAARTPTAPAVRYGDADELVYGELEDRANRLARYLLARGAGPEIRVGIAIERSSELVTALLAVLKTGAAYVPLDPGYPDERLRWLVADAALGLVLVGSGAAADRRRLLTLAGARAIDLAGERARVDGQSAGPLPPAGHPESLAYIVYTSGSTGQPKGVAVTHRGVLRLVTGTDYVAIGTRDRVAQASTAVFDAATFEIWGALLNGACLVGIDQQVALSPPAFAAALRQRGITVLYLTVALFSLMAREVPRAFAGVGTLLFGGEAIDPQRLREVLAAGPAARLIHVYGPTETTAWNSWERVERVAPGARSISIGRPIANDTLYVLDRQLSLMPRGAIGELCIGGAGLARGYWGRPELTAERFVPDPFGSAGGRLYRTGDLGRLGGDGRLEFSGRVDAQVKIRGHRIEPGEVEAALAAHPEVAQALALAREDQPGERRLVAYVVPAGGDPRGLPQRLRQLLLERLPRYMIPAAIVVLPALPLTPVGKVDRHALPAPESAAADDGTAQLPRTPTEELLAGIWAEVLGRDGIGAEQDFFALGGHSLMAIQVVSRIRRWFGCELPLQVLFDAPGLVDLAARIDVERAAADGRAVVPPPPLERQATGGRAPLSFAQQRLWFLHLLEPASPAYNVAMPLQLAGDLRPALLGRVLGELARRHEVLRSRIETVGGRPFQVVEPALPDVVRQVDLAGLPPAARRREAERLTREELQRPFDLTRLPLLRLTLLQLEARLWTALFAMHHVVTDGWSLGLLVREISTLYAAVAEGRPSPLPELPVQYADFAVWQRRWLAGATLRAEVEHWRERLAGSPVLELPADRPRRALPPSRGASLPLLIAPAIVAPLRAAARAGGATTFMALLAGFEVLLNRYSLQPRFNVGTAAAGRGRLETEGLVGFFVNTLALAADLGGDPCFGELLARVRETTLSAFAHQDLPFEKLVEELEPERDLARPPLVQVFFALQNAPMGELALPRLVLNPLPLEGGTAKFELSLLLTETPAGFAGALEYRADLFDRATISRLAGSLRAVLAAVAAAPERRLSAAPALLPPEQDQLLREWNDSASGRVGEPTVTELFAAQVARAPRATAVAWAGGAVSYAELDAAAGRLARRLRRLGVGPEVRVAVCLRRSPALVAAVLGVLRAGGAYVPLDPSYPVARLHWMLDDALGGLPRPVLVSDDECLAHLAPLPPLPPAVLRLDAAELGADGATEGGEDALEGGVAAPLPSAGPDQLAYVLYTSGSTGRPKGVMVHHRGLANYLAWCLAAYPLAPGTAVPLHSSIGFDLTVTSLLAPLAAGAAVVVLPEHDEMPALAAALVRGESYSLVKLTPSHLRLLTQLLPPAGGDAGAAGAAAGAVGMLVLGGEALFAGDLAAFRQRAPASRVVNEYGPTETVVGCATEEIGAGLPGAGPVPIGRPIRNLRLHLLDAELRACPLGGRGEICIGGHGVARGYLGRPELTAERFVPDPCARPGDGAGGRLYRSGDLGRHLPDGRLEYLGRLDQQVKVRGYRIELGEIEAVLGRHPAVRQAAVLAQVGPAGAHRVVAYIVAATGSEPPPAAQLRSFLGGQLPGPMVPAAFVTVPALPITVNGKVDRQALARLEGKPLAACEVAYAPPRSELETAIAGVWQEVLGVPRVGVDDPFFDLGGHSMALLEIHARLCQVLGRDLPLADLFRAPTVAALARHLTGEDAGAAWRQGDDRGASRLAARRRRERRGAPGQADGAAP